MNDNNDNLATIVKTSQRNYKVLVGYKSIEALGNELESLNVNGKIFLISDNSIFPEFILKIHHILEKSNFWSPYQLVVETLGVMSVMKLVKKVKKNFSSPFLIKNT